MTALDQLTPPSALVSWTATSQTTKFVAYNIYRRAAGMPVRPWVKVGRIAVPASGLTATQVEALHTKWIDYEPGWFRDQGGQWEQGWDYAITVETTLGLEAIIGTILAGNVVPAARNAWVCSNEAPWLNSPLQIVPSGESTNDSQQVVRRYKGRDLAVVRTPADLAPRQFSAGGLFMATVGPDQLRYLRAAEASGRQVSFLRQNGDRVTGALTVSKWKDADGGAQYQDVTIGVTETGRAPMLADYNLPAGASLNGSSQYVTTPDNALLKQTGSFSVVVAGVFPTASGKVHLGKGNSAAANSWAIKNTSSTLMSFLVNNSTVCSITTPTDGLPHVVGVTVDANLNVVSMYLDGVLAASATPGVSVDQSSNTGAFVLGADNSGASGYSALAPGSSWGYWQSTKLTATQQAALGHYLLNHPGYRPAAGASAFYDLRDRRSYSTSGTALVLDLSGNGLHATLVASPPITGYAWPLVDLEQF